MTKTRWKKRIKASCEEAGTYRPFFDCAIDTLAGILERRDKAQEVYDQSGGNPVVLHTYKNGQQNIEQNPALKVISDMNKDALAYWRDLGLTPAGLKRLNESSMKTVPEKKTMESVLAGIGI